MTLRLPGIDVGDEVIVTSYKYIAFASAVDPVGAKIMDYDKLDATITQKTKGSVLVLCLYKKIVHKYT